MGQIQKELLTPEDFIAIYSISKSKFYREVKRGKIKLSRIDRCTFVKRTDAEKWLDNIGKENL